jgi:F-type H+-transporting ATPase subunit b
MAFFQEATNWVLISFVIFAIGFWKFGLKLMLGKLDGRIEEIRKEIETAESLRIEAQELLAQYQRKQRDAAKEAEAIVASAQKHAAEIQKAAEAELNELIARKEAQLKDRLQRMEDVALQDIKSYAAELAVKATAEIIAKQMDEKTNARLVEQSIKTVAGHLN